MERLAPAHDVWALTRRSPEPVGGDGVRWLVHDLAHDGMPAGLPDGLDAVIHLAQSRHYREFPGRADDIVAVNVRGTLAALEWARALKARRFVHLSTGGLGGPSAAPIPENAEPKPSGPLAFYLASKGGAELLAKSYASFFVPVVLRPFFVYGPGQQAGMLIPRLVDKVRKGEPIGLRPPDGIRINPVHVDDVVTAIVRALALDEGAVVNVAGPDVLTIGEIVRVIGASLKIEPYIEMAPESPAGDLIGDIRTMAALLGRPSIGFRDGVARLCRSPAPSPAGGQQT